MFLFKMMIAYSKAKFLGIPLPFFPILLLVAFIITWEIVKRRPTKRRKNARRKVPRRN